MPLASIISREQPGEKRLKSAIESRPAFRMSTFRLGTCPEQRTAILPCPLVPNRHIPVPVIRPPDERKSKNELNSTETSEKNAHKHKM